MLEIAKKAKESSVKLAALSTEIKNKVLYNIADKISLNRKKIIEANLMDLEEADSLLKDNKISQPTYNRLKLDDDKFRDMVQGLKNVAQLPDPVNKVLFEKELDDGLILKKVSCPIGLIGVIFEARPDVISQISALAIKSGNSVILKGGSEAKYTNKILFETILSATDEINEFPKFAVNQVYSREDVSKMLELDKYIDLIIPRGGNSLVKFIKENTKIPVLGHSDGICHLFIDKTADKDMAENISVDAKTQYPSACNSIETIVIHKEYPYIKELILKLKENNVKIKGDEICQKIFPEIEPANEQDWLTEYGDKVISIKVVNDIEEAITHINNYGSHHTDAIITQDENNALLFTSLVDSAGVYVNASTRFADGFRYGFGAEVGISTNKTHARGPVGLEGLTIYKYILTGSGHIVNDYIKGYKTFKFNHQ